MPVVYKLIAKMMVHRLHRTLDVGLHSYQYGFIPRRQIHDNISNALTAIEYAKYSHQDVLILQVDIAKAFDTVQWDFISQIMFKLGFGPKMANAVFWLYSGSTSQCILGNHLSRSWTLGRSI